MEISVGQHNTGCENKIRDLLRGLLPEDAKAAVEHLPYPDFRKGIKVSTGEKSFIVSLEEVQQGTDASLIKILKDRLG